MTMIGGGMLFCAVAAMVVIAWWSLSRDDAKDQATGLLALKTWSDRTVSRKHGTANKRNRRPAPAATGKRDRRPKEGTRRR